MNKYFMHNAESVRESETHKRLWDFEIKTDHLISAKRLDLIIVNKKIISSMNSGLCRPGRQQSVNEESEKTNYHLDLANELKKNNGTWRWRWY